MNSRIYQIVSDGYSEMLDSDWANMVSFSVADCDNFWLQALSSGDDQHGDFIPARINCAFPDKNLIDLINNFPSNWEIVEEQDGVFITFTYGTFIRSTVINWIVRYFVEYLQLEKDSVVVSELVAI